MSDVTPVPLDEAYLEEISGGLDRAAEHADEQAFDPATERIVIFSDHHRGTGDAADDFRRCEHAYTAALGYYLEAGYRLFLLGDVEELWEERAGPVIDHYRAVIELEAEFTTRGGLERFYGNHDDDWRNPGPVKQHLWPRAREDPGPRGAAADDPARGQAAGDAALPARAPGHRGQRSLGMGLAAVRALRLAAAAAAHGVLGHDPREQLRPACEARPRDVRVVADAGARPRAPRRTHAPAGVRARHARSAADPVDRRARAAPGRARRR